MNLLKTLASISGLTLLSRITGLIREMMVTSAFGASGYTDAFNVAFRIPNLLRRLFAEGAFSQAFVPILGEVKNRQGDVQTKLLVDAVATVLTWTLLLTSILGVIFTPQIVDLFASGLKSQTGPAFASAIFMTRVMFPYVMLISLVALASGILNTWKQFAVPAFTPVLLNVSFILAAWLLSPRLETPIYGMAYGVLLGGIAQLAIQVPALAKIGMMPRIGFNLRQAWHHEGVRRILKKMLPAILAMSAAQISLIINTNIASHLPAGSISWITYADRLMEFPTAMLGVALGTILLPSLSKAHAQGETKHYSDLLDWGLRLTFLLAAPCAIGLLFFGEPLTATIFHRGRFSGNDVLMTGMALQSYGVGLLGLILIKILAPGFFARQDIRTPVKIALLVLVVTQALNYVFVPFMAHAGLALATSLGACLNAGLLFYGLKRKGIYHPSKGWWLFLMQLLGALCILAGALSWLAQNFDWVELGHDAWIRIALLAACLVFSAAIYFGALILMGFKFSFLKRKEH